MDPKLNLAATTSLGGRTLKVNIYVAGGRGGGGEEKEEEGGGGEGDRRRLEEEGGGELVLRFWQSKTHKMLRGRLFN